MKRSAWGHPKLERLALELGVPMYAAIGILESIWIWAGKFTPRGDLGRYPDDLIARAIQWDGDATALIEALVASGWVDRSDQLRLVIHDWRHHADEAVRKQLARDGLSFASGTCRDSVETTSRQHPDAVWRVS